MATTGDLADGLLRAVNAHDAAKVGELLADNVSFWEANLPAPINGRKAVEEHMKENWRTFPDSAARLLKRVESGDSCADELDWSGTNTGSITTPDQKTIPATGKRAEGRAVALLKAEGGKVSSLRVYYDNLAFMTQLGLAPPPASE